MYRLPRTSQCPHCHARIAWSPLDPIPPPPSLADPTTALPPYSPQVCQRSISQLVPASQNPASSSSSLLSPFLHPIRERRKEEAGAPLPAMARSSDEGGSPSKEKSSGVATPLDLFGRRRVLAGREKEDAFHLVQLLVRGVALAHCRRFLSAQSRLLLPSFPSSLSLLFRPFLYSQIFPPLPPCLFLVVATPKGGDRAPPSFPPSFPPCRPVLLLLAGMHRAHEKHPFEA